MIINEIFYSLQGEGYWTGTPAVFVRFSGCNLNCDFCDTDHQHGQDFSEEYIIEQILKYPTTHVIFTGGEPSLQLTRSLADKLHKLGKYLHMETNGSIKLPDNIDRSIDWITVSPKSAQLNIQRIDELKVLYHGAGQDMTPYNNIKTTNNCLYLQPCDMQDPVINQCIINEAIEYIKNNPTWKLSVQMHKLLGIR